VNILTAPSSDPFALLSATLLSADTKGIPPAAAPIALGAVGQQGWNLLRGDLVFPVAVLRQSALENNSRWMRSFIEARGLAIAPHGKTTMAPQLFRRQIDDGAWGMTVATIQQLSVCRRFGFDRLLLANEPVGQQELDYIFKELARSASLEIYCLVDSLDGVGRIAAAGRRAGIPARLQLLLEVGIPGGRGGCRSIELALEVARAVKREGLTLRGVEAFEGILKEAGPVNDFLDVLCQTAAAMAREGLFAPGRAILLTAGGSAFYDLAAARLALHDLPSEVKIITRSGCYLTHDSLRYENSYRALRARSHDLPPGDFVPALMVWTHVQSRPESGLAVLAMGRRDVSYDLDLPLALLWYRPGLHESPVEIGAGYSTAVLYDQHVCVNCPPESGLAVGDLVGFGISHPCTTFDKWQVLYVIDDRYDIVDAVRTFF
jgi:D-serine dehydratase